MATVLTAAAAFLLLCVSQVFVEGSVSQLKLNSRILQESIIKEVNENPKAGWQATMNPPFANYTPLHGDCSGAAPRLSLTGSNTKYLRADGYQELRFSSIDSTDDRVGKFKRLLGVLPIPEKELVDVPVIRHPKPLWLPKEFDARSAWPQCSTIRRILDQGHCGACWAFGAVESLSDRFCIHFGKNVSLSVNDLLSCCGFLCGFGCNGGYPYSAWRYLAHHGVVTEECDPYFDDTGCSHPGCEPGYPTPKCVRKCADENQLWRKSKHYSTKAYRIHSDPKEIMAEVYKNGPVEVAFDVFEDFAHYKSGVYKHITGSKLGGHAVKIIGWGTSDEGEDYWLLANSWNRSWGDDGFFKIRRGTNECGIEKSPTAGLPSAKNLALEDAPPRYASA